ncbi:MAG: biotin transporter BioY [Actinomycetes bacterium]
MPHTTTRELTYVALFAALIAVGAFVSVPVGAVPFTLQVLFVLLASMMLGPRLGAVSVAAYLVLGLIAPVYAGGSSGIGVLFGPTGGFLWGFVLAAVLTGAIASLRPRTLWAVMVAGLAGITPIYALGAVWLALQAHITLGAALAVGVVPFVWTDALKAIGAGLIARSLVSLPLGLPWPQRGR